MRVAVFASWGTSDFPNYTRYHIDQLKPFHDEVHIVTNEGRPVDETWCKDRGYKLHFFPNKGRDYEKYYYWLMKMGKEWVCKLDSLSMINDSIICYGPLDKFFNWAYQQGQDLVGLNGMIFPLFHVQGSPLIANQRFLPQLWEHFKERGVVSPIDEITHYELGFPELTQSLLAKYGQGKRRGWDELFSLPFEDGIPLVKHYCISPRKPLHLRRWQKRIKEFAHPDTKEWWLLPLCLDSQYVFRSEASDEFKHT